MSVPYHCANPDCENDQMIGEAGLSGTNTSRCPECDRETRYSMADGAELIEEDNSLY